MVGSGQIQTGLPLSRRPTPEDPVLASRAPDNRRAWIALQVIDTGVGIAPADQQRIFDEFEQVRPEGRGDSQHRGTGLGLTISRRLARLLGGDVVASSNVGAGSRFTVILPIRPPLAGRPLAPSEQAVQEVIRLSGESATDTERPIAVEAEQAKPALDVPHPDEPPDGGRGRPTDVNPRAR